MSPPVCSSSVFPTLSATLRGFSLVELLTVLAVMSVLATMVTPALTSIFSGKSSSRAMETITNTAAVARQTAMTTGLPVAMVVSRPTSVIDESQGVLLLSGSLSGSGGTEWAPKGTWSKLPNAVQLSIRQRSGEQAGFYEQGGTMFSGALPVKLNGKDVTAYDSIIFYPNGSISAPVNGPALTVRRTNSGLAEDVVDYTVVFQSDSGRAKVITN